jgi:L-alanine-DL-glutamate epimerase-like enolase superfamily enzyme
MPKPTDVRPIAASLYYLPIKTRMPLKFGPETTTEVTCARVRLTVTDPQGRTADGWGETPLSVQWVWPSTRPYQERLDALKRFTEGLVDDWASFDTWGHPIEVGHALVERSRTRTEIPDLASLVCNSAFDLALHDAFGVLHGLPTYETYNARFMNDDLSHYLDRVEGSGAAFAARFPADFLESPRPDRLVAWHLVGGKDPIDEGDLTGDEPVDGYPVLLRDWVRRDGLKCLKVKLTGTDPAWDLDRLLRVGRVAIEEGADWLSTDFNCTVSEPAYVNDILDRLMRDHPRIFGMILYVEQPFPYDLEKHRIDVRSVAARKPLFMDESAHDWKLIRLGRSLGWSGVALKTCKTQTGAILSLCWSRAHGMTLMVQDLTNPMLAQVPHALLAAHAGTIMGVETNAMQFYPDASLPEAAAHPGLYRRRAGKVRLDTISGPGLGYRLDQIARELPAADVAFN